MDEPPRHATENIETILALEEEAQPPLPLRHRLAEWVGDFAGSPAFITLHLLWFLAWAGLNLGVEPFDPWPFNLLALLLAMEAVLLSACVLLRQNRQAELAEERSHIDLQINLLAERETTKVIQMLARISHAMGIADAVVDDEAAELGEATTVAALARKLRERRR